ETRTTRLPVFGRVEDFHLIDTNKNEFARKDLKDKIWICNFIFTSCGGICPTMTRNMKELFERLKDLPQIEFVSFSVNPETDTPQVLAQYAQKYGETSNRWHSLTGTMEEIKELAV